MVTRAILPRASLSLAAAGLITALTAVAAAGDPPPHAPAAAPAPAEPDAHHAPLSSAPAHEALRFEVDLDHPELVRWIGLVYRAPDGPWKTVPFLREGSGYVAVLAAEFIDAPEIAYTIELQRTDGTTAAVFASRAEPWPVEVIEDRTDARERAALERLGGRRSVATAVSEFVGFGATSGRSQIPCGSGQSCAPGQLVTPTIDDQYWRVELGYTYRPLRTVAEFGLRGGVVRGQSLVEGVSTFELARYKVGLNYAAPSVQFRLADAWHLEIEALTSITEVGFSVGGGGALLIGDPYGSKLTLGFETIGFGDQYFGSRFYSRVDLMAHEGVRIVPTIEVTNMPHAESYGVRLLTDLSVDVGHGFALMVRGGYQARRSTSGGFTAGGSVALGF